MSRDSGQPRPSNACPEARAPGAGSMPPAMPQGVEVSAEDWRQTPPSVRALVLRLLAEWAEGREELAALVSRLEELEERLRTDSHNSSKPPSSDPPSSPGPKGPEGRPQGERKPGGQPGHEGKSRPLVPPEDVAQVVECRPRPRSATAGERSSRRAGSRSAGQGAAAPSGAPSSRSHRGTSRHETAQSRASGGS